MLITKALRLINTPVSLINKKQFLDEVISLCSNKTQGYIGILAVHNIVEAYLSRRHQATLEGALMNTADGKPVAKAVSLLSNNEQEQLSGCDLLPELLPLIENNNLNLAVFGGTSKTLELFEKRCHLEFPKLKLVGCISPPMGNVDELSSDQLITELNQLEADIVFVALGCPKQEQWMAKNSSKLNAILIGFGAAVPVYAGTEKRAPKWLRNLYLEWFYRFIQSPKRLLIRYWVYNTLFVLLVSRQFIQKFLFKQKYTEAVL